MKNLEREEVFYREQTFCERLFEEYAEKELFVFHNSKNEVTSLTGKQLGFKVHCIGKQLKAILDAQEKAVIALPQGLDFIIAMLGCFHANVIAIPLDISKIGDVQSFHDKIAGIVEDSKASCLIVDNEFLKYFNQDKTLQDMKVICIENIEEYECDDKPRNHEEDEIGILLYTSGSSAKPKGVELTHLNVLFQAIGGSEQCEIKHDSIVVSWMPQFHSFGLVFNILAPLLHGAKCITFSPELFISEPEVWLKLLNQYQATHTAASNFAFDYCCSAIEMSDLNNIDLSSIHGIFCGGEAVRKQTVDNFIRKFKSLGLRENIFCPLYGMSESGPASTLKPGENIYSLRLELGSLAEGKAVIAKETDKCKDFISCGKVRGQFQIVCINLENMQVCQEEEVGEIWVAGPSVTSGYYNREEVTKENCNRSVPGYDGKFYRTGDLGFLRNEHLFIIGRVKEVMIIHGKKYHPVDMEWTIKNKLPDLALRLCIFSDDIEEQERILVVAEVESGLSISELEIRAKQLSSCIAEDYGVNIYKTAFVEENSIPRTGSGKLQRKKCCTYLKDGKLNVLYQYGGKQERCDIKEMKTDKAEVKNQIMEIEEILRYEMIPDLCHVSQKELEQVEYVSEMAFDSVKFIKLSKMLVDRFQITCTPVNLFKFPTIREIAAFVAERIKESKPENKMEAKPDAAEDITETQNIELEEEIAVVGMSCNLPGGLVSPEKYWKSIWNGEDSIEEIAIKRPDLVRDFYESYGDVSSTMPKYGGFVDGYDCFDAAFFGISPVEAESMDPQQRKTLEMVWAAIEDAGYDPTAYKGENVGLFLGVHANDYSELFAKHKGLLADYGAYLDTGAHMCIIPNRISRWFDFHGPSETINTACSSSLIAIHRAVRAIRAGECTTAIAGGINLILSTRIYAAGDKAGMFSKDGRCKTLDESANGFVRSEGYGALVLKTLKAAIEDGDSIYGIIKGSAENHDGHSSSLRAPNMMAQKNLILSAYQDAKLPVQTITNIEMHGTGTPLGDPIEFQALREAFEELGDNDTEKHCAVTSVKTNIGHCESASGIASIIKVLLCMKYKKIPKILHLKKMNQYLEIENSPFYPVTDNMEWKCLRQADGSSIPRRAGISSFGVGGSNAHVVLEEFSKEEYIEDNNSAVILPISAKTQESLRLAIVNLVEHLEEHQQYSKLNLAYTLAVGRCEFAFRKAFVVNSIEDAIRKMRQYLDGGSVLDSQRETVWNGDFNNLETLSAYWEKGNRVDWEAMYKEKRTSRLHLPTYAFEQKKFWFTVSKKESFVHPLLQENCSDFMEQKFVTRLTGEEFFLTDHKINGVSVLPGVTTIEMAHEAILKSCGNENDEDVNVLITDIIWKKPVEAEKKTIELTISLMPQKEGMAKFQIFAKEGSENAEVLHSEGTACVVSAKNDVIDIKEESRTYENKVSIRKFYEEFEKTGIQYGEGFKTIKDLYVKDQTAIGKVVLSDKLDYTCSSYYLHPALLDGALQSVTALINHSDSKLRVPFKIDSVVISSSCEKTMWVKTEKEQDGKFHIDFVREDGTRSVSIKGFTLVEISKSAGADKEQICLFTKEWYQKEQIYTEQLNVERKICIFIEPEKELAQKCKQNEKNICIVLNSYKRTAKERYKEYAKELFHILKEQMSSAFKRPILVQLIINTEEEVYSGLEAELLTAAQENPAVLVQTVLYNSKSNLSEEMLKAEAVNQGSRLVCFEDGIRYAAKWNQVSNSSREVEIPWKDNGVYLITGGTGGIGMLFAKEIAKKTKNATIILTGRTETNERIREKLRSIETRDATVIYESVDISKEEEFILKFKNLVEKYNKINGILHVAGIIRDNYILNKVDEEFDDVMTAKVDGLDNIIQICRKAPVDFVVTFASISGVLGNAGQIDYAVANSYMNSISKKTEKSDGIGRFININWALWKNGGMRVDEQTEQRMKSTIGMSAMPDKAGIDAFYQVFNSGLSNVMVLYGNIDRINKYIDEKKLNVKERTSVIKADENEVREKAEHYFKILLSDVLKMPVDMIDAKTEMGEMGIDSVIILQLTERLEETFGPVSKTLFFEYRTLRQLSAYFVDAFNEKMLSVLKIKQNIESESMKQEHRQIEVMEPKRTYRHLINKGINEESTKARIHEDIAIIGIAGHYPQADNLQEFWKNLCDGKNCITEVPETRWDHSKFFDADKTAEGKTYTKWGGFLKDVECFDPLFFKISPREAELMDPQERLILTCVQEMLEDAGYTKDEIENYQYGAEKGKVGVFVGAMFEEYQLYGAQMQALGQPDAVSGSISSIANRISYYYNLHGPSIALDTMCSSSLTALHFACESIHNNDCGLAIVGGVNVSIHPNKYLLLAKGRFASSEGLCRAFGEGGDGYVPGEGVGAVLLKPLSKAEEDGDHIYGVIKATAVNHGGKTNGFTVPNPAAQAEVIKEALTKADINPRMISYVETHGTGTSLGDPIEIKGLTTAFEIETKEKGFCAIGSVKSNIGHCESAAGMASLSKVLLQMKYGKLVTSLHSDVLNSNINFEETPFFVQHGLTDWKRPTIQINGEECLCKRIAGISAFGAGGSNAHVIVEEYQKETEEAYPVDKPVIILLTAKKKEQLKELATRMISAIEEKELEEKDLERIAYTLQVGRTFYSERLAILTETLEELKEKLMDYTVDIQQDGVFEGNAKENKFFEDYMDEDDDMKYMVESWIAKKKFRKLLGVWTSGLNIDWRNMYRDKKIEKISLPTYPFVKERYWFPDYMKNVSVHVKTENDELHIIHPLLHTNISTLQEQKYVSVFTGSEFFLRDHIVGDKKTLPGAACIEMARAACVDAGSDWEDNQLELLEITWIRPVQITEDRKHVYIRLYEIEQGKIEFEIYQSENKVCCTGIMQVDKRKKNRNHKDIKKLLTECQESQMDKEQCYNIFTHMGINYGNAHKGVEEINIGKDMAVAKITLPKEADEEGTYYLNPAITDSALQAAVGLFHKEIAEQGILLPYSIGKITIYGSTNKRMWAIIRRTGYAERDIESVDIDVYNETGDIAVQMKKVSFRFAEMLSIYEPEQYETVSFIPVWIQEDME